MTFTPAKYFENCPNKMTANSSEFISQCEMNVLSCDLIKAMNNY